MKNRRSYTILTETWCLETKRLSEQNDTIFSGVNFGEFNESTYNDFTKSGNYDMMLNESSKYEAMQICREFLYESVFSVIYEMKQKQTDNITFKEQFIFENTLSQNKLLEESNLLVGGALLGTGLGTSSVVLGGLLGFAITMLTPTRILSKYKNFITQWGGVLGNAVIGLNGLSNRLDLDPRNFGFLLDNIDLSPEVQKFVKKMSKHNMSPQATVKELDRFFEPCVEQSNMFANAELTKTESNTVSQILHKDYDPHKNNLLREFVIEKLASKDVDGDHVPSIMLEYRKCVFDKLIDLYKSMAVVALSSISNKKLMIQSVQSVHKTDLGDIYSEFVGRSKGTMDKHDVEVGKVIKSINTYKVFIDNIADEMQKSSDRYTHEAGSHMSRKIAQCDKEISNLMRKTASYKFEGDNEESRSEFNKKEFKHNETSQSDKKRSLLGNF